MTNWLWRAARGFTTHGATGTGLSSLATAAGAGMLGKSAGAVGSAVGVAAGSNAVILGLVGAALGFFEADHHLFVKPEKITDLIFWAKMFALIGAKTIAAAIGSAIAYNSENPNSLTAGQAAASNLLGSTVLSVGPVFLAYGMFRCCKAITNCAVKSETPRLGV